MDPRDLRQLSDEQLLDELEDLKEAHFKLRLQEASGQLEDVTQLKRTQRDVARVKTIMRERELAAARVANEDENA
jgi:large subunit ribosomal protein L29